MRRSRFLPSVSALAALVVVGCATTIPDVDTTPPRVEFRLSGPGIGSQTISNPPLENWESETLPSGPYLRFLPNELYRFTLVVSDQGGVEQARVVLPDVLVLEEGYAPSSAQVGMTARHTELVVFGNRSAPVNSMVLTGSFRTPDRIEPDTLVTPDGIYISLMGYDFGGRTGARNPNVMILRAGLREN